jgi:hypothetical protein
MAIKTVISIVLVLFIIGSIIWLRIRNNNRAGK